MEDCSVKKCEPHGWQSDASGISNASSANEGGAMEESFTEDFTGNFQDLVWKNMNHDENTPNDMPREPEPEPYVQPGLPTSTRILKALARKIIPKFSWHGR